MSRSVPRHFTPSGWDKVKVETMRKEKKLRNTSADTFDTIRGNYGKVAPAGWAWFTSAGFCDANDVQRIKKERIRPMPAWDTDRAAGHDTYEQKLAVITERAMPNGHDMFVNRTQPPDLSFMSRTSTLPIRSVGTISAAIKLEQSRRLTGMLDPASMPAAGAPTSMAMAMGQYAAQPGVSRSASCSRLPDPAQPYQASGGSSHRSSSTAGLTTSGASGALRGALAAA